MTILVHEFAKPEAVLQRIAKARPALWVVVVAVASFVLVALRNPHLLLDAQFYAEDGGVWYPDAYAHGWMSLLFPAGGYLNSFQRLIALACITLAPLSATPFIFNAVALVVEMLPVALLLSPRGEQIVKPLLPRLVLSVIYLALPNASELTGHLTNSAWYLAVLAFLVLFVRPAESWTGAIGDALALLLSGLSGPFCFFLLPISCVQWFRRSGGRKFVCSLVLATCCAVQAVFLLGPQGGRSPAPLGASLNALMHILALHIVGSAELGGFAAGLVSSSAGVILLSLIGFAAVVVAIPKAPLPLLMFMLFSAAVVAGGLWRPLASMTNPQWPIMQHPLAGHRYFVFAMISWVGCILVLVASPDAPRKIFGWALLAPLVLIAIPSDWFVTDMPHSDFQERAAQFAQAPVGSQMDFSIYPGATMVLVKK